MRKPSDSTRAAATIAAVIAAGWLVAARQAGPEQRPVFRSGVELVTIDVNVVDRQGRPVRGLAPSDFTVTVEGQARRVVSAEFVDVAAAKAQSAAMATISTNEGAGIGRQIVFVVDQATLETSSARYVARAASKFFSQLTFADRTGLILLPVGKTVSLTWSHDQVQAALQRLAGSSSTIAGWEYGSLSEARDIANRNMTALRAVGQRECGTAAASGRGAGPAGPPGGTATGAGSTPPGGGAGGSGGGTSTMGSGAGLGMDACMRTVQIHAETAWRIAHMTSLSSLAALRQVLDTLGRVNGDKTVILISGGWPLDQHDEVSTLTPLAAAAAAARVTLFPIFVPRNRFSASQQSMSSTPVQDHSIQSGPLQTLASMTGGEFLRAEVSAESMFERLAREMEGYYRVGVEKTAGDQDGKARRLQVAVARSGSTVRARDRFDVRSYEDRNWTARLAAALDSPLPADGIPLRITSYVCLDPDSPSRLNLVLAGDARRIQPGEATIEVVVRDLDGKKILSGEPPATTATENGLEFGMNVPVPPGSYVVRVGVMDSTGQVGSVEHRVDARREPMGALTATGPLLARVPAHAGAEPRIVLGGASQDERLALELALEGEREQIEKTEVAFEIASTVNGPALVNALGSLSRGAFEGAYLAQAVTDMRMLPPGEYVARVKVRSGAAAEGQLLRWFSVTGSTPAVTIANGPAATAIPRAAAPPPTAKIVGAVQPFALEHVLAPQVLGGFVDRVAARPDAASPAVRALVERARTDGVSQLTVSDALAAESPVAVFFRGLTLFSAQQFEAAATAFRQALRASPDMFPAMVYLGACYAAGGKDKEAANAWQTALIGTGDSVAVHRLLADALLRQGNHERALQAVERARAKWPDDAMLKQRFVVTALLAGRRLEALQALDALLESGPGVDEPTLTLALLVLYDAFEHRQPIEGVEPDRARMLRLAERYRVKGGPSLALIETWVAAVTGKG